MAEVDVNCSYLRMQPRMEGIIRVAGQWSTPAHLTPWSELVLSEMLPNMIKRHGVKGAMEINLPFSLVPQGNKSSVHFSLSVENCNST